MCISLIGTKITSKVQVLFNLLNKIIKGYSDNLFRPNAFVNRVEALKILLKASDLEIDAADTVYYKDTDKISWYAKYLAFATRNGIVRGYSNNTFRPANQITRAEVAKIVIKILELK